MSISVASGSSARRKDGSGGDAAAVEVVRQLVSVVRDTSVRRLHVRTDQLEIEIEHDPGTGHAGPVAARPAAGPARTEEERDVPDAGDGLVDVVSPTVGVAHVATRPDGTGAVAVGAVVDHKTEVAQVEAMKLITPVLAGCAGVVTEVCFQDGEVVEFGQLLFRVRPGTDGEDAGDATV